MKTEAEILEGNKLIAEFMGAKKHFSDIYYIPEFGHYYNSYGKIEYEDSFRPDELKYNKSWDWLMPAVEKIESLGCQTFNDVGITSYSRFEIRHNNIKLYWSKDHGYQLFLEVIPKWMSDSSFIISKKQIRINVTKDTTKIESLWLAVIEFIKWYNTKDNNLKK